MKKGIVCVAIFALAAGLADAATIRYRQSGNWTNTAPLNTGPGWQNVSAVPGLDDVGRINWGNNTVTVTTTETIGKLQVGVDEQGNLVIGNGGSLTTSGAGTQNGDLTVGQGNNPAGTGTMTVQSGGMVNVGNILYHGNNASGTSDIYGTVNVASHLWTGWGAGQTGTINVNNGGVLNVSGMLGLNWQDNGSIGLLNVNDGGTVNLAQIHGAGDSVKGASSKVTIAGSGLLTKSGNFVNVIQTLYVDTGKIVGDGGATVSVVYDSGQDKTLVTIPEPATIGLIAAFGGTMLFVRRRLSF